MGLVRVGVRVGVRAGVGVRVGGWGVEVARVRVRATSTGLARLRLIFALT